MEDLLDENPKALVYMHDTARDHGSVIFDLLMDGGSC